jgi:hypothetical protein
VLVVELTPGFIDEHPDIDHRRSNAYTACIFTGKTAILLLGKGRALI